MTRTFLAALGVALLLAGPPAQAGYDEARATFDALPRGVRNAVALGLIATGDFEGLAAQGITRLDILEYISHGITKTPVPGEPTGSLARMGMRDLPALAARRQQQAGVERGEFGEFRRGLDDGEVLNGGQGLPRHAQPLAPRSSSAWARAASTRARWIASNCAALSLMCRISTRSYPGAPR